MNCGGDDAFSFSSWAVMGTTFPRWNQVAWPRKSALAPKTSVESSRLFTPLTSLLQRILRPWRMKVAWILESLHVEQTDAQERPEISMLEFVKIRSNLPS